MGIVGQRFAQLAALGFLKLAGEYNQTTQRVSFLVNRIHRPVVGIPGVIGEKGQGQAEKHADDIDEGRHDAIERAHPGRPWRTLHQPVNGGHRRKGAENGDQRVAVMIVGVSVAEIHDSSVPFGQNDAPGCQLLLKGERGVRGAGGW